MSDKTQTAKWKDFDDLESERNAYRQGWNDAVEQQTTCEAIGRAKGRLEAFQQCRFVIEQKLEAAIESIDEHIHIEMSSIEEMEKQNGKDSKG